MKTIFLALIVSFAAQAQLVTNPTRVEFDPSPDHNVILPSTQPAVTEYIFMVFNNSTGALVTSGTLGKPDPDMSGKIIVNILSMIASIGPGATVYHAKIAARGPQGDGVSTPSNLWMIGVAPGLPNAPSNLIIVPVKKAEPEPKRDDSALP